MKSTSNINNTETWKELTGLIGHRQNKTKIDLQSYIKEIIPVSYIDWIFNMIMEKKLPQTRKRHGHTDKRKIQYQNIAGQRRKSLRQIIVKILHMHNRENTLNSSGKPIRTPAGIWVKTLKAREVWNNAFQVWKDYEFYPRVNIVSKTIPHN